MRMRTAMKADAPDDVVFPIPEVVGDVAAADLFQCREVEFGQPGFVDKAAQQVAHHFRVREEQLVTVVVVV